MAETLLGVSPPSSKDPADKELNRSGDLCLGIGDFIKAAVVVLREDAETSGLPLHPGTGHL
jgi:hypothetical protein